MGLTFLQNTEFWVNGITLNGANLTDMATTVAAALSLQANEILVVDVCSDRVVFDVSATDIPIEKTRGKESAILEALSGVAGVALLENACIRSNGILGRICSGTGKAGQNNKTLLDITAELMAKSSKRAIIFPASFDTRRSLIEYTSTPYLKQQLETRGYAVKVGESPGKSPKDIRAKLDEAVSRGYGLILATGGNSSGGKNHTVESILQLDPGAVIPYIAKLRQDTECQETDRVRIGVGRGGSCLLVSLPNRQDEVEAAAPVLLRGLEEGWSKELLADRLAEALAEK